MTDIGSHSLEINDFAADTLRDPGAPCRVRDGLLHDGFVQMKTRWQAPSRIRAHPKSGKDKPLPLDRLEMACHRLGNGGRQDGCPAVAEFLDPYCVNYAWAEGLHDPATIMGGLNAITAMLGNQPVTGPLPMSDDRP